MSEPAGNAFNDPDLEQRAVDMGRGQPAVPARGETVERAKEAAADCRQAAASAFEYENRPTGRSLRYEEAAESIDGLLELLEQREAWIVTWQEREAQLQDELEGAEAALAQAERWWADKHLAEQQAAMRMVDTAKKALAQAEQERDEARKDCDFYKWKVDDEVRRLRAEAAKLVVLMEGFMYNDSAVSEGGLIAAIHRFMTKQELELPTNEALTAAEAALAVAREHEETLARRVRELEDAIGWDETASPALRAALAGQPAAGEAEGGTA